MKLRALFPVFLFAAGLYAQTPTITSIQNPASNILTGLPNFGIAQGSIFVLYGANLGPTTLAQPTALPWPNLLAGTSIKVTGFGNSTVYNAPLIYTLNSQVAAVMPSAVPLGLGATVQVTYNGVAGNVFTTRVTDSNFGISTVDTTGTGTAVLTDGNYNVITKTNSAIPGATYAMWGTGLGAANSDNNIATNGDLGTPLQVFVGGVQAILTYRGRSGAPGLDQINFTIPPGVTGCYVSLVVQTNTTTPSRVSNGPTIPIATGGGTCSDVNTIPLSTVSAALSSKGSLTFEGVSLKGDKQQAIAFFLRFTQAQFAAVNGGLLSTVSPGSCATFVSSNSSGSGGQGVPVSTGLDAGTSLLLTSPSGSIVTMPLSQTGVYGGNLPGVSPGAYKLSNGSGGSVVGAFNVSFNGPPAFAWTNSNITTVTRTGGLKITWNGGDANSTVDIQGSAASSPVMVNGNLVQTNNGVSFDCQAPAAAGSFTIPASVLLAMPAVTGSITNGSIQVELGTNPQALALPGADLAFAVTNTAAVTAANVSFQ